MTTIVEDDRRNDTLTGVERLVYRNGNEIIPQWRPSDYFTPVDVEELRALTSGDSLWADVELDPVRGNVRGYERMRITCVQSDPKHSCVHVGFESSVLSGETSITEGNIEGYFRLTDKNGLANLVREHGRLITHIDPSKQIGGYGDSLKIIRYRAPVAEGVTNATDNKN